VSLVNPKPVISIMIGALVVFTIISAFISPVEKGVTSFESALDESVTGELLGTADASGNLAAYTQHPVTVGSETVYANGTASTAWVNATYTIDYDTGLVNVTATGSNPSTAGATITIDYTRADAYGKDVKGLPKTAYLIALLAAFVAIIYAFWSRE
jgi:hypothetical protein